MHILDELLECREKSIIDGLAPFQGVAGYVVVSNSV